MAAQQLALSRYRQLSKSNSKLASNDIHKIVPAAIHGKIDTLSVASGTQQWGKYDPQKDLLEQHHHHELGDQDLFDLCAVHTWLNRSVVYVSQPEDMPDGSPLAAIFRYPEAQV